jgi:hypothetical protein
VASDRAATAAGAHLRASYPCVGSDLAQARACEQAVFGRRFGNSAEEMEHEYGPFEGSTTFGAVFATNGTAVAAVRLIRPGPVRVKTLQDAAKPPWSLAEQQLTDTVGLHERHTWDVASFTVDAVAGGADRRIAPTLLRLLFAALRANSATSFVAVLDSTARRALRGLGVTMLELGDAKPAPYLGSPSSVPVYRHLADLRGEHAEHFPQTDEQVPTAEVSAVPSRC